MCMDVISHVTLAKRSVTLDLAKLRRVRRMIKARNDSETIRWLVEKELALQLAVKANQDFRNAGGLRAVIWR